MYVQGGAIAPPSIRLAPPLVGQAISIAYNVFGRV